MCIRYSVLRSLLAAVFSGLLLIPSITYATHSMGADMSYECLGNNNYKIRVSFYRDCSGIPAPFAVDVDIHSTICGIDTFAVLTPIPGTGQDITPLCPSDTSTCHGGSFTGIQEWVYEGIFHFPAQCTDWNLSYSLCCRNGAITAIQFPLSENITIFSTLNNTITPCNNSPTFSNKPVPFVCLGQTFSFNHGAYDADGDSLVYSVLTPLSVNSAPVQYWNPYSASQPLNSVPAMTLDAHTGDFTITPQSLEVTVMAILVSEYRNGVLIGTVERDIQVTVINCTNILPVLSGINGTNSFSATICADAPFCFDVFSNDPDSGQNVTLSWDNAIPTGLLNSNGTPRPIGNFCWTPTQADASPIPHCFTATVTDDACPFLGSQTFSYCLTVVNVSVDAGPDQTVNCGGLATISATSTTSSGNVTYQWSNGVSTQSQQVGPGTYTVTATNGGCSTTDVVQINPISGPAAAFNAPPVCFPANINFTDNSTVSGGGTVSNWLWDFGDGTTSAQQSPAHPFAAAGTYNVCLTVTSTGNCTSTICQSVTVNSATVPAFTTANNCEGTPTNFNNTSPLVGNTFSWDLGNGTNSSTISPTITYATAGTFNVTLTSTNATGCTASIQQQVTVDPNPVAGFSSIVTPCSNSQVLFTDTSSPTPSTWNWDFGNGQTSATQNPSVTLSPGINTVTLEVITAAGCSDTFVQNVNVIPAFTASNIPPQTICIGGNATLTATGGTSYLWDGGQNSASINVNPNTTTNYIVNITDGNGCSDTTITTVNVNPLPIVSAGSDVNICLGTNTVLAASGASTYLWSNGATTQSITVSPATATTYTVTGTDINGCVNTANVNVGVNPLLNVVLTNPTMCAGETAILDAGFPGGATYLWSSGQTTQTISVSAAGTYSVTVTESTGCTGIGLSNVIVNPLPIVSAGNNVGICDGSSTQLNASGTNFYVWSDGSTTASITVSPITATTYTVTGTNMLGCSSTSSVTVTINPNPSVSFNTLPVCDYDSMYFNNTSSVTSGNIASYQWDFNDGSNSTLQQPAHYYGNEGVYNVTLTTVSNAGCIGTSSSPVTVYSSPIASFQGIDVCIGLPTIFSESSTVANDVISGWNWTFGDGTIASGNVQTHTYSTDGLFHVLLIATTSHGCRDSIINDVNVHPLPSVNAGPDVTLCSGATVNVGDVAQNGHTYQWLPLAGITQPTAALTSLQLNNGGLNVIDVYYYLTATSQFGCIKADSILVHVKPLPAVYLDSPGPQCLQGNSFTFSPSGNIDPNSQLSWTFGSNASPSFSNQPFPPPVTYSTEGIHLITLNYSYAGCPGLPILDTVIILETPPTGFVPSSFQGCAPFTATFHNTNHNSANTYTWNIAGDTTSGMDPSWTFNSPGTYIVTMNVQSINGCSATPYTLPVTVYGNPIAAFDHTPEHSLLYEALVQFKNNSVGASQYDWDFGDGSTATFLDGQHMYTDTGTFLITLIVTSSYGCKDTIDGIVTVEEGFSFYVPNAFSPNEDGDNDSFQGYGTFISDYEMWIYDRWGLKIYHTTDYNSPWDGRINSMAQNDVYVYRIRVTDRREKDHIFIGTVTLVK